jgi:hypothetical protein
MGLEPVMVNYPGASEYRGRRDQPEEGLSHINSAAPREMLLLF